MPLRAVLYLPAAHGHGEAAENGMDQLARSSLLEGGHQGLDPALIGHAPKNGGHGDDAGLAAQVLHLGPGAVRVFMDAQGLLAPVFHALHFKGDAPEGGVLQRQIPCHANAPPRRRGFALTARGFADHDVLAALGQHGTVQFQRAVQLHLDRLGLCRCLHILCGLQQDGLPFFR